MTVQVVVRRGAYVDSIVAMQVAEQVGRLPGIETAALLMGTDANRASLRAAGLWAAEIDAAAADDLIVAVRAADPETARGGIARAQELLRARRSTGGGEAAAAERPRSIRVAARAAQGATLAMISVPGEYAALEAQQALAAGLHVFLFSDGVSLADEVALKRRARERGLLVMGPECGTSIIGGVGLGFANRVRRGAVGLVGASGTGLQEVTTLVHRLGGGVSHAIGTGGRDLHERVGGVTTLQGIEWLAKDASTGVIVIVSKPASAPVAETVLAAAARAGKPVVACLLGWSGATPAGVRAVRTLEDAAVAAVTATGISAPMFRTSERRAVSAPSVVGRSARLAGLFTGGTLCEEARAIAGEAAARFVDFGAEEYTRGRPHPMIAPELRSAAIAAAGDDAAVGVVLLDVVLGDCAHPDPAGAAVAAIDEARARAQRAGRSLAVVAHVVGTDDDPQRLATQEDALRAAGVVVCPTNRLAAEVARDIARGGKETTDGA